MSHDKTDNTAGHARPLINPTTLKELRLRAKRAAQVAGLTGDALDDFLDGWKPSITEIQEHAE